MVRPKTTLAPIRERFKMEGARYERPALYSVAVRSFLSTPITPLAAVSLLAVGATLFPPQCDVVKGIIIGVCVLLAIWGVWTSVRQDRITQERVDARFQEVMRALRRQARALGISDDVISRIGARIEERVRLGDEFTATVIKGGKAANRSTESDPQSPKDDR